VLDEKERQDALSSPSPGIQARLVFSAKEATYKALFPIFRRFLQFLDVHIDVLPHGAFLSTLRRSSGCGLSGSPMMGHFVADEDLLVTGVVLTDPGLPLAQEGVKLHHVPC
jgi:4'-phosphopantetheinyl transferase EntD